MEFGQAKRLIEENLRAVEESCFTLVSGYVKEEDLRALRETIRRKIDSGRNLNVFLEGVNQLYDLIERVSTGVSYDLERAAAMKSVIADLTLYVSDLLSNMYPADRFEGGLFELEQFNNLMASHVFSIGIYINRDKKAAPRGGEERSLESQGADASAENSRELQYDPSSALTFINYISSSDSKYRNIIYENLRLSAAWVVYSGLMTRASYLNILLKFFRPGDESVAFKLTVYTLVSPGKKDDKGTAGDVDKVLVDSFGVLPDEVKKDIIEQCTYRDLFREAPATELPDSRIDPCPKKVLESTMRQHVSQMLLTLWKDEGEEGRKKRELLKYNCLDCAYVSARLKELISPEFWEKKDEPELSGCDEIRDNHDNMLRMSRDFNIVLSDIHVLVMHLEDEKVTIRFYDTDGRDRSGESAGTSCDAAYRTDDWQLDGLREVLKNNAILEKARDYSKKPNGSDFRYSLIYLENYRGIDRVCISFDHRYAFARDEKAVCLEEEDTDGLINHYYGKKILSMSSFVGKNGAGKTSIVDFLRESFLRICNDLYNENLQSENGVIDLEPSAMARYRLKPDTLGEGGETVCGTRFFVVFHFNKKDYFLTNLRLRTGDFGEKASLESAAEAKSSVFQNLAGVEPYQVGKCLPLYSGNRKIVYFSQFLSPAGVADEENEQYRAESKGLTSEEGGKRKPEAATGDAGDADGDGGAIDLSEEYFNRLRQPAGKVGSPNLNISLIMQLMFCFYKKDGLKVYFKEDFQVSELEVRSHNLGADGAARVNGLKGANLVRILTDTMAYIRPFSSGQYSKFVLLSRVFWCIKGWMLFPRMFRSRSKTNSIDLEWENNRQQRVFRKFTWDEIRDEITGHYLRQTDSAVLFFDEADTYYHPDWQRSFVQDMADMIERGRTNPVQVVFTTNSPLMLSDLRQEDIYLMKDYGKDSSVSNPGESVNALGRWNPSVPTFGQNIHTLMAKPFFLDRTIGRFADQRIEWLVSLLTDTTEIVIFLRSYEEDKTKTEDIQALRKKLRKEYKGIDRKVGFILKKVSDQIPGVFTAQNRKAVKSLRKIAGCAEKEFVISETEKKFFEEGRVRPDKHISFECVEVILKAHIKLIGEDVLRKELLDMYDDFISRVEYGMELEELIEKRRAELRKLEEKQGRLAEDQESIGW